MFKDINQTQSSGDYSTNQQAGGNFYIDQRQIMVVSKPEDVNILLEQLSKENLPFLKNDALVVVGERLNTFSETLCEKIKELEHDVEKLSKIYESFKNPSMQYSLIEAQKSFIKSGEQQKLNILTNLLIKKGLEQNETTTQLVVDEAIKILDRINNKHLQILGIFMSVLCLKRVNVFSLDTYLSELKKDFSIVDANFIINPKNILWLEENKCIHAMDAVSHFDVYKLLYNANDIGKAFNLSINDFKQIIDKETQVVAKINSFWESANQSPMIYSSRTHLEHFDLTLVGRMLAYTYLHNKTGLTVPISFD